MQDGNIWMSLSKRLQTVHVPLSGEVLSHPQEDHQYPHIQSQWQESGILVRAWSLLR